MDCLGLGYGWAEHGAQTQTNTAMLPNGLIKLIWERLSVKGTVPKGDWWNWNIKVMFEWNDQRSWKIGTTGLLEFQKLCNTITEQPLLYL